MEENKIELKLWIRDFEMKILIEKYRCDYCKVDIDEATDYVKTESVQYEGSSSISLKTKTVYINYGHFCNLQCLFSYIKKELGVEDEDEIFIR